MQGIRFGILYKTHGFSKKLFPLHRHQRLAGYVVDHPGDAIHLVHDALGDFLQELVRQARLAGDREIDGFQEAHCSSITQATPSATHPVYPSRTGC